MEQVGVRDRRARGHKIKWLKKHVEIYKVLGSNAILMGQGRVDFESNTIIYSTISGRIVLALLVMTTTQFDIWRKVEIKTMPLLQIYICEV